MNEEQAKQIIELLLDIKGALANVQAQLKDLDKKVNRYC